MIFETQLFSRLNNSDIKNGEKFIGNRISRRTNEKFVAAEFTFSVAKYRQSFRIRNLEITQIYGNGFVERFIGEIEEFVKHSNVYSVIAFEFLGVWRRMTNNLKNNSIFQITNQLFTLSQSVSIQVHQIPFLEKCLQVYASPDKFMVVHQLQKILVDYTCQIIQGNYVYTVTSIKVLGVFNFETIREVLSIVSRNPTRQVYSELTVCKNIALQRNIPFTLEKSLVINWNHRYYIGDEISSDKIWVAPHYDMMELDYDESYDGILYAPSNMDPIVFEKDFEGNLIPVGQYYNGKLGGICPELLEKYKYI